MPLRASPTTVAFGIDDTLEAREAARFAAEVARERVLRDASQMSAMLVLGRHHFDLGDPLLTGRVGSAVAARATCPVVVVPVGWGRTDTARRPVVAALDVEQSASAALRYAFEEAERRQVTLVALHVIPLHREIASLDEERAALHEVIAGSEADFPDVDVQTTLVLGDPSAQITRASLTAGLVVVGRPHRGRGEASWSHSVARTLMDRSSCPLVITPDQIGSFPPRRRAVSLGSGRA